jgi:hypothetical protein
MMTKILISVILISNILLITNINKVIIEKDSNVISINDEKFNIKEFNISNSLLIKNEKIHQKKRTVILNKRLFQKRYYVHKIIFTKLGIEVSGIFAIKKVKKIKNFHVDNINLQFGSEYTSKLTILGEHINETTTYSDIMNSKNLRNSIDYSLYHDKENPSKYFINIKLTHFDIMFHFSKQSNGLIEKISIRPYYSDNDIKYSKVKTLQICRISEQV